MKMIFKNKILNLITAGFFFVAAILGFIGLLWVDGLNYIGKGVYYLVFGEIDGASDMDEDIVLCWPDGSKDEIHYHCSDHRIWPEPKCNRSWKLNGENHEGNVFQFVGKSSQ